MERPIIFSGPMVKAILEGRKVQSRRVVKPQPTVLQDWAAIGIAGVRFRTATIAENCLNMQNYIDELAAEECPYGQAGDRLWVKETFWVLDELGDPLTVPQPIHYDADGHTRSLEDYHKVSSIFMPRWASRITLELTGVRVERVQDISEEDAVAEGIEAKEPNHVVSARYRYGQDWNDINRKRGYSWDINPWIWALTFRVLP